MPRHKGRAIKKTKKPDTKSCFRYRLKPVGFPRGTSSKLVVFTAGRFLYEAAPSGAEDRYDPASKKTLSIVFFRRTRDGAAANFADVVFV
jgi:hypothetical protein